MPKKKETRLGKLPPQYTFILNPYAEYRFTRCPICNQKTKLRKLPLFIHVDPKQPVVLNKTCRYCPDCDLLIAHQDEIESALAQLFDRYDPSAIGNDYLVLGTVERQAWHVGMKQPKDIPDMLEHLHDFKEVRRIEVQPGGWYPDEESQGRKSGQGKRDNKPARGERQETKRKRKRRRRG
jgi:hypothetical protein